MNAPAAAPKTRSAAAPAPSGAGLTITLPMLAQGEHYAGILLDDSGKLSHHLILVPGEFTGTWPKAQAWAQANGGELPTRREQSLLFANLKQYFKTDDPYWSGEQSADAPSYAWYQWFHDGNQNSWSKDDKNRACLVRRVPIR